MSRLECFEKSSAVSQKQALKKSTSYNNDDDTPNDKVGRKQAIKKVCSSLPARAQPCSEQVSCQVTEKSGERLNTEAQSPNEFISITPRICAEAHSTAFPDKELKMKEQKNLQPPDSTVTGATAHAVEPVIGQDAVGDEELTKEEDLKAPLMLKIKLLNALEDNDFELSRKLCEMILIYEPEHPKASELLQLICRKLMEEQESDEEDDEEDDNKDSESDEQSSYTSSCSSSSSDDNGCDNGDGKQVNSNKPCPAANMSP